MLTCRHCGDEVGNKKGLYDHLASNVCGWKERDRDTPSHAPPPIRVKTPGHIKMDQEEPEIIIRDNNEPGPVYAAEETLERWIQDTAREVDEDEAETEWGE